MAVIAVLEPPTLIEQVKVWDLPLLFNACNLAVEMVRVEVWEVPL